MPIEGGPNRYDALDGGTLNSLQTSSQEVFESIQSDPDRFSFFAENGGEWPVITAGADGASLDYGVKKLPESFLVDPSGEVVVKINGGVTADQLDAMIAERTEGS